MQPERQTQIRRFGNFELDLRARELRKGGVRIRLQDQPFEILKVLLDRPGDVVSRDELCHQLWPDGTYVDFEHSLNAAVKRLRAALGDDADTPRFVETLHRRGYRFIGSVESSDGGWKPATASAPRIPAASAAASTVRLAVLPFANLSGDPAQEYFSDGLTEEMITQISRLCPSRLGVIARTSSMLFKSAEKSASEIGRALGVDYLLEGSVRRDGDRIRITAQLIETKTEVHLWAESYDRAVRETLILQADVAAHVARSLAMELVPAHVEVLGRATARRTDAYQLYLKGRYQWNRGTAESVHQALSYYDRALALDPDFAAAHAATARARVALANHARQPARELLEQARESATRALALDPGLSDAHVALGEVRRSLEWKWRLAEDSYRTAIALSPSCESAHRFFAQFLGALGRSAEAKAEADRACDVDPLCLVVATAAAWVRYLAGELDSAIDRCRHVIEMDPEFRLARRLLGAALLGVGRPDEAVRELKAAAAIDPTDSISAAWLAHALALAGAHEDAQALITQLETAEARAYVSGYHFALAHVGVGHYDAASSALERAIVERDPGLVNIGVEPRFDPFRRDRRYAGLAATLQLPR